VGAHDLHWRSETLADAHAAALLAVRLDLQHHHRHVVVRLGVADEGFHFSQHALADAGGVEAGWLESTRASAGVAEELAVASSPR
jgi:hypothetical protein